MDGTVSLEEIREAAGSSLFLVGRIYERRSDGDLKFCGVRPGPGWQGHGYFPRRLWVLEGGQLRRCRLWKRRWRHPAQGTCHSRPPDDLGRLSVCALAFVLALFGWLSGPGGVHTHEPVFPDLGSTPSPRTAQRWLARTLPQALATQQAIRLAVIERCEPRPVESLFPSGLSPPEGFSRRRWRDPPQAAILWRAFALLLGAASRLGTPAALLLAEARGRKSQGQSTE